MAWPCVRETLNEYRVCGIRGVLAKLMSNGETERGGVAGRMQMNGKMKDKDGMEIGLDGYGRAETCLGVGAGVFVSSWLISLNNCLV